MNIIFLEMEVLGKIYFYNKSMKYKKTIEVDYMFFDILSLNENKIVLEAHVVHKLGMKNITNHKRS